MIPSVIFFNVNWWWLAHMSCCAVILAPLLFHQRSQCTGFNFLNRHVNEEFSDFYLKSVL